MNRLRRPESFDEVSAEGLFRATSMPAILAGRGAIFVQGLPGLLGAGGFPSAKIPTKQEVLQAGSFIFESSSCADAHVDVFVSHCWSSGRWAKFLALCFYFNLTAAVLCSLTAWLLATAGMIAYAHGATNLGGNHLLLPILVHFPIVVFLVVFFFGQHAVHRLQPTSMWLDRACIHQTDHDFKHRQIQALPVFVARSSSMLVLWDDEYFRRLWCQLELATFAKYGGDQEVRFLPLWMAPWLLSALLVNSLVAALWSMLNYRGPQEVLISVTYSCTMVLPQSFLDSSWGFLVSDTVWSVLLGTTLGILASIPWTIACRAKLQSHELMLRQMASFDCRAAECTIEADRLLVEQQVQTLFQSRQEEEAVVQAPSSPGSYEHVQTESNASTALGTDGIVAPGVPSTAYLAGSATAGIPRNSVTSTEIDQKALDAFNSYIRGPLRRVVMESVGNQLHVPYRICLVAALPLILYSPVDLLQCGADCRARYNFPSLETGFRSEMLSWLVVIFLVLPIFYPILLRMLKQAFTVQSQKLQLVLAILSAVLTFTYGYFCAGVVDGLVYNIFQQGLVGLVPVFALLVILLLLQLRCLFGNGPAFASTHVDGTYRALHAEDDFSI
ncbi:unnamed protein product [Symbiodinium natans]|uniref:Transmembrane protein n=1 Tax=Symbiodinium natans TaxID=878477 RepID=A0A812LW56_9DINO|nr:unnamed protein product [Symbiodinium natans]